MREHNRDNETQGTTVQTNRRHAETDLNSNKSVLVSVERTETLVNHVDLERINAELPDGWTAKPDLIQTDSDPLAETLLFRRSLSEPQLVLKPADPRTPTKSIECYERSGPHAASERTMTIDRLPEAVRVAVNRVHQFER